MTHIKQIDGLRCVAIGMVLATHWGVSKIFPVSIPLGTMGVNLFFVISGFLISLILLNLKEVRETNSVSGFQLLKNFYIRRSLRIFPIYYSTILICVILGVQPTDDILGWLLTYTLNLGVCFKGINPGIFLPFWSLAVEEQFYLVFPLLILVTPSKHLVKLFCGMTALAVLTRFIFNYSGITEMRDGIISYQLTICCFDTFGCGALLAYFFKNYPNQLEIFIRKYFWASGVFLVLFFIVEFTVKGFSGGTTLGRLFFSLTCFGVIGFACSQKGFGGIIGWFLEHRVVIYLGKISYGIYVYHNFVGEFVGYYIDEPAFRFLLRLALTISIASISWKFFELPINRLKRKFEYQTNA